MIKDTLKFSGKIFVIFIAITVFTLIGLTLILGSNISQPLRLLAGGFFILFYVGMLWDNCTRWGEKDCKAVITYVRNRGSEEQLKEAKGQLFHPLKGFIAGAVAMLVPFVLTVIYTIIAYKGWEKGLAAAADTIYTILFYLFMAYTPFLVLASPVCTTQAFVFGVPATSFTNFSIPNMVMPYMFFIPVIVFVLICGVCYIMGFNKRRMEVPQHMRGVYFPPDHKYAPIQEEPQQSQEEREEAGQAESVVQAQDSGEGNDEA